MNKSLPCCGLVPALFSCQPAVSLFSNIKSDAPFPGQGNPKFITFAKDRNVGELHGKTVATGIPHMCHIEGASIAVPVGDDTMQPRLVPPTTLCASPGSDWIELVTLTVSFSSVRGSGPRWCEHPESPGWGSLCPTVVFLPLHHWSFVSPAVLWCGEPQSGPWCHRLGRSAALSSRH